MEIKVQQNPSKMVPKQEKKKEYQELNKPWKSASPRMVLQHENETPPPPPHRLLYYRLNKHMGLKSYLIFCSLKCLKPMKTKNKKKDTQSEFVVKPWRNRRPCALKVCEMPEIILSLCVSLCVCVCGGM